MKLKFKLLVVLIAIALSTKAGDFTREVHQGFVKSSIQALDVTNKFGEIRISDYGGDSITVDVIITVESATESKAEYLLNQIEIQINKQGSTLVLETDIKDNFKSKQSFSIDYRINIPDDRDLTVENKFGNVAVSSLNAKGRFSVNYGNINTGPLECPDGSSIDLEIGYGKADIESVNNLDCEIKYSKLFLGEAKKIIAESKYSVINAEELGYLNLESKYDGINVEELGELKANSKYTNYDIEELKKSFVLDTEYGSVRIDEAGAEFDLIDITNSYGGISIGFSNPVFNIDAECSYCDVKLPEVEFSGNRIKDNFRLNLNGTVGSTSATAKVKIQSRYGGVKLTD
ncbi:hypothetical protein ACUNWD_15225 [Sunxiuqinia sp. A32]|uniref:hypothetical protein n=1 Tax=Sunxiuqinia sp. A32 TaxID=3461496 RepID=UPI004045A883